MNDYPVDENEHPVLDNAPGVAAIHQLLREVKRSYPNWKHPPAIEKGLWNSLLWDWRCNLQKYPVDYLLPALVHHTKKNPDTPPEPGHLWVAMDEIKNNVKPEGDSAGAKAMNAMREKNPGMFAGR